MSRIVSTGRMGDVVNVRAPGTDVGGAVRAATAKTANVAVSPAARRAVAAMPAGERDDIIARAVAVARTRDAARVWDIDVAVACGFAPTPDGAAAFRASIGTRAAAPWPSAPTWNTAADRAAAVAAGGRTARVPASTVVTDADVGDAAPDA